jgi:hypothetical protein
MEQSNELLFYIDQYIDGYFFSRSEPFYDREECVSYYNTIAVNNTQSNLEHKLSVSLSVVDYDRLLLKTKQTKVMFLDRPDEGLKTTTSDFSSESSFSSITPTKAVVVWRHTNGYYLKNNKRSKAFLDSEGLTRHAKFNESKNKYFISDQKIEKYQLDFIKRANIKVGKSLISGNSVD